MKTFQHQVTLVEPLCNTLRFSTAAVLRWYLGQSELALLSGLWALLALLPANSPGFRLSLGCCAQSSAFIPLQQPPQWPPCPSSLSTLMWLELV